MHIQRVMLMFLALIFFSVYACNPTATSNLTLLRRYTLAYGR